MAIRSGMFNSVRDGQGNGDRKYLAEFFAAYFSSFIGNGIFPNPSTGLQIMAGGNMRTIVKSGKGWIDGYFLINDGDVYLDHDTSDAILKRIDRVVMRLDFGARSIEIKVKKGQFASSPVAPSLERTAYAWELALADVTVRNGVLEITQTDIADTRMNTELCGIVHGVIDQVDTTTIFNQYQDWFNEYSIEKASEFLKWQEKVTAELETWITNEQTDFESWKQSEELLFKTWSDGQKADFESWFQTIKDILDTNVAGNLQNEIDNHLNSSMPHKFLIGSDVYKYGLALNPTLNCVSFIYEEE